MRLNHGLAVYIFGDIYPSFHLIEVLGHDVHRERLDVWNIESIQRLVFPPADVVLDAFVLQHPS